MSTIGIRNLYEEMGVDEYYLKNAGNYHNPHESIIKKLIEIAKNNNLIGQKVLDLCCGSGEITRMLSNNHEIVGIDPYMHQIYTERTRRMSYPWSFIDIKNGNIQENFDTIICSFALHLCPKSLLPDVLWNLGLISKNLIVISPNKNPNCDGISNWILVDEMILNRVRMKVYYK